MSSKQLMVDIILTVTVLAMSRADAIDWPHPGKCPDIAVMESFDLSQYDGVWFPQAGYDTERVEGPGRCGFTEITTNSNQAFATVEMRKINENDEWEERSAIVSYADPEKKDGKLVISVKGKWFGTMTGPYWVLDTDYASFSVVYSCKTELLLFHYYSIWVLSRVQVFENQIDEDTFNVQISNVLRDHKLDPSLLQRANQTYC